MKIIFDDLMVGISVLNSHWDLAEEATGICCEKYLLDSLIRYSIDTPIELILGLLDFLKKAAIILGVTTAVGAIGGAAGGVEGAAAGALLGIKLGTFVVQLLGFGYLMSYAATALVSLGDVFFNFLNALIKANEDKRFIDEAAKFLADGIGQIWGLLIFAMIAFVTAKGVKALKNSKLGERLSNPKVVKWLEEKAKGKNGVESGANVLVEYGGNKVPIYRGGNNFILKANEIKINPQTGLVKTTHGISLDVNTDVISKFGGAYRIESIPEGLKIIQRGQRLEYFEIVPAYEISVEQFQSLLNQIKVKPIE